jgi:YggT family protein
MGNLQVLNRICFITTAYRILMASGSILTMTVSNIAALGLGFLLGTMILLFILRIVMSWYPDLDLQRLPFNVIYRVTEPFLSPSRKLIPPLGGVDITPILWVGIFSLLRELLLGQQGLITMALF